MVPLFPSRLTICGTSGWVCALAGCDIAEEGRAMDVLKDTKCSEIDSAMFANVVGTLEALILVVPGMEVAACIGGAIRDRLALVV
mmetsp:Transcript_115508/g.224719  ORF Transcript_115508/g.224719 Transcript_115508/m.224719 type:complete len:85 (+) Transcript_115508:1125-1379(+)